MDTSKNSIPAPRGRDLQTPARTFAIFFTLGRFLKDGRSVEALEKDCGIPRRSVERHLDFLEQIGWVYRGGNHRYFVNPAARIPLGAANHEGIDKVLDDFVDRTGRDVALATLSGGKLAITHLHKDPNGKSLLEGIHPRAIHATGSGKCLLSQLPSVEERHRLMILNGMPRFTDRTITDFKALEANLQAQESELWSAEGEYCETGACLAVLVHPGSTYADSIALTTSVQASEFAQAKADLTANLHRAVALLQPVIGPLLPSVFGTRIALRPEAVGHAGPDGLPSGPALI